MEEKTEVIGQLDFFNVPFVSMIPLFLLAQIIKNYSVLRDLPDYNVQRDSILGFE